jgi:hypothetical protein
MSKLTEPSSCNYFCFFLHVHTREMGGRIRNRDLHFIRRNLQSIELLLEIVYVIVNDYYIDS